MLISSKNIAAIDIGTNSAHMVVANIDKESQLNVLDVHKTYLRLGNELDEETKKISQEGIEKTVDTIKQMKEISAVYDPIFRVVATHCIRVSENKEEIIKRIYDETGARLEIIDGLEEARLVSLGMQYGLPLKDLVFLGVDIGGGSTELVVCKENNLNYLSSIQLGSVMLTKKYLHDEHIPDHAIDEAKAYIDSRLAPQENELKTLKYDTAIISSGVAKAIANMKMKSSLKDFDPNGFCFSAKQLLQLNTKLTSLRYPDKIRKNWKIETNRSEIILAGTMILQAITKCLGVKNWKVCTYGLREGLVVDTYNRLHHRDSKTFDTANIRWKSVINLGNQLLIDTRQAENVSRLALSLYKSLEKIQPNKEKDHVEISNFELLKAAAWLHECGKFINYPRYHHHTKYLLLNSRIVGFSQKERLFIGLVARFHRNGQASKKNKDCKGLSVKDIDRINFLSSILRLAVAANRTRKGLIDDISFCESNKTQFLLIKYAGNERPNVDIRKIDSEKKYIEKVLNLVLKINCTKGH